MRDASRRLGRLLTLLALFAAALALPAAAAADTTVRLEDDGFDFVKVDAGEVIHFTNRTGKPWSVTSDEGLFDSKALGATGAYSMSLSVPGEHAFRSSPGGQTGTIVVRGRKLGGDDTDPAGVRIPDLPFPGADPDQVDTHPDFGIEASMERILLGFTDDATVGQANAALAEADVRIIGGNPGLGLLLVETEQAGWSSSFWSLDRALARLRGAPGVRFASMSTSVVETAAPRKTDAATAAITPGWDWDAFEGKGNAGLVSSRFPDAWNLVESLRRTNPQVVTGIIDAGFQAHDDLENLTIQNQLCPGGGGDCETLTNVPDDHGNHVAGIIGATYDNDAGFPKRSKGVSGGNPLAKMHGYSSEGFARFGTRFFDGDGASVLDKEIELLDLVLRSRPAAMRVINHSMTAVQFDPAEWQEANQFRACGPGAADDDLKRPKFLQPCNPDNHDGWQREISNMGQAAATVLRAASRQGVLIVQAAGNSGATFCAGGPCGSGAPADPIDAASNSEFGWAGRHWEDALVGHELANPVLTVQNHGADNFASFDSAINADISAPGDEILSTVTGNTYAKKRGTSMAAPQVAAAAGLLLADDPAMTLPDLRRRLLDWGSGRPSTGTVDFTWSMPDRMNRDDNGDGLVDYPTVNGHIEPSRWKVDLDACDASAGGAPIGTYTWSVDGQVVGSTPDCVFRWRPAAEGTYDVTLTATAGGGQEQTVSHQVKVEDMLIVSVGDSIASGEGNPDIASPFSRWQEDRCHRSAFAGPAQAARVLEQEDAKSSVTFVHLACSGARMRGDVEDDLQTIKLGALGVGGLLTPYEGVLDSDYSTPCATSRRTSSDCEPPQLDAAKELLGGREPDAITVSIGANDMIFSKILEACMLEVKTCTSEDSVNGKQLFENRIVRLEERYYAVARKIESLWPDLDPSRVIITPYPDLTQDETGTVTLSCGVASGVSQAEAEWAAQTVLPALNGKVAAAAAAHGWTLAGGIAESFHRHGYCSNDPWIVDVTGSGIFQGGKDGAFHPNYQGHASYAKFILQNLRPKLGADEAKATAPRGPRDRAPRLNAFRSLAAGADATRVADVNDPSRDGNRRIERTVGTDGATAEKPDTRLSFDPKDHAAPDGKVDMRDLRRFRDAWLQRCLDGGDGCPSSTAISLDGDDLHPKKDLNWDGCVTGDAALCGAKETQFSRFDFNADQQIDPFNEALVPWKADGKPAEGRAAGTRMSDLDVLKAAWTGGDGAEGWAKGDLETLLKSADVEVEADAVLDTGAGKAELAIRKKGGANVGPKRTLRRRDGSVVMTVPVDAPGQEYELLATATSASGTQTSTSAPFTLEHGEDTLVAVCPNISLKATPTTVPADNESKSMISATVHKCAGRDVADKDISFTLSPTEGGASVTPVGGTTTDANGKAYAEFKAGTVQREYVVEVEVDMGEEAEPLKGELVIKTIPKIKVKYLWTQTITQWNESGQTNRWTTVGMPDCVGAGRPYCIEDFSVGLHSQQGLKRAGTLTGGGRSFKLTEQVFGAQASSQADWRLTHLADGNTEEGGKRATWAVQDPTTYTDHALDGVTAADDAGGIRLEGLQAVGDLPYMYDMFAQGTGGTTDPIEGHSANNSTLLIPQGGGHIRFAAQPDEDVVFRRDGSTFKPYSSCGVMDQDLTTQPGYRVPGANPYVPNATSIGRKTTYAPGDIPLPYGQGRLKVTYAFAAVAGYESQSLPEPVLPDCSAPNPPSANFDYAPADGETAREGRDVHFESLSTDADNDIVKTEWDFGDGKSATGVTAAHLYDDDGTYTVKVKVTDAKGNVDEHTQELVVVNEAPEAEILDAVAQQSKLTVRYRMLDPGHVDKKDLEWRITSSNPDFQPLSGHDHGGVWWRGPFTNLPAGTYPLTLTIKDKDGATATDDAVVVVTETEPPPPPPAETRTYATCDTNVKLDGEERDFLDLVNEYREENGLPPVEVSATLTRAADRHAADMAAKDYMAHEGKDGSTPASRAFDALYPRTAGVGENLAESETADEALFAWRASSTGHNENMLNPAWRAIGIARANGSKWRWATSYGTAQDCPAAVAPGRTDGDQSAGFTRTATDDGAEIREARTLGSEPREEAADDTGLDEPDWTDGGALLRDAPAAAVAAEEPSPAPLHGPTVAVAIKEDDATAGRPFEVANRSRTATGAPLAATFDFGDDSAEKVLAPEAAELHSYPLDAYWDQYRLEVEAKDPQNRVAKLNRWVEVWPDDPPDMTVRHSDQLAVADKPYEVVVDMADPRHSRPLAGLALTFTVGDRVVTATTNADGRAKASVRLLPAEGHQVIQIAFAGDERWKATSAQRSVSARLNKAPVAQHGGPYRLGEGEPIRLNATKSTDPDNDPGFSKIEKYEWDLDGDAAFDDATGKLPTAIGAHVYRELMCGGTCRADHDYPVAVRVTDTWGETSAASTTVRFVADFDLLLRAEKLTVVPGQANHFAVTVIGSESYKKPVTLSAIDLPQGVTATWSKQTVTPSDVSVLTLTANQLVENGEFPVKVRGVGEDGLTREISDELNVAFGLVPVCKGSFAGTVTNKAGVPLAGAIVSPLYGYGFGAAETDASGRFVVEDIALGSNNAPVTYQLIVRAPGHWPVSSSEVTISCGAAPEVGTALLDVRKGKVRGKVVDKKTGAILPDAEIKASVCTDGQWPCVEKTVARTGGDGWFEHEPHLGQNNSATYFDGTAHFPGYWSASDRVQIEEGKTSTGLYELVKQCRGKLIGGHVYYIGEDGKPDTTKPAKKAGVGIYLNGNFFPDLTVMTDDQGRYVVDREVLLGQNNAPRWIQAYPTAPADAPPNTTGYNGYFKLDECGQAASVDLALKSPKANYGSLTGKVTDQASGEPMADVWVHLNNRNRSAKTDANGEYAFDQIFLGWDGGTSDSVVTSVSLDGFHPASGSATVTTTKPGRANIAVVRKKFGAHTISVVDAVTKAPIPNAKVSGDSSCSSLCWFTDRQGKATGKNIPLSDYPAYNSPRPMSLKASANGYWDQSKTGTLKAGETTPYVFELQPECAPARVSGTVVNAETGDPLEGASINASGTTVSTGADGKFVIDDIKPSDGNNPRRVWITASKGGFYSQSKEITIFCGARVTVDFARTSRTSTIIGTVKDGDTGQVLAGAFVGTEFGATATTDANGNYRIEQVPLGDLNSDREWKVNVKPAGYKAKTQSVTVTRDAERRLDFTFNQANVKPTAAGQAIELDEDTQKQLTLAGADPDGDDLSYHVMAFPQHGTLTGRLPNVTYKPDANFSGTDSFEFITNDTVDSSERATVNVVVKPLNDAPGARADSLEGRPDTPLTIPAATLLANDIDVDGETLKITKVEVGHDDATATLDEQTGEIAFTPPPGWSSDTSYAFLRYWVRDAAGQEDWAFVYIRVQEGPAAPTCLDRTFTVQAGGTLSESVACTDVNGDTVTHTKLSDPSGGTLAFANAGTFVYTPPAGWTGTTTFTYRGSDGALESPARTVTINVVPPNAAPSCVDVNANGEEDGTVDVTLACTDADEDALTVAPVTQPAQGTLAPLGNDKYRYTPPANWSGVATFTYRATDEHQTQSAPATVRLTIAAVDDRPVCKDVSLASDGTPAEVAPDCSDVEGDPLTYEIASGGEQGTATVDGGKLRYAPSASAFGADAFTYRARDAGGASVPARASVAISRQPDGVPPVARDLVVETDEDAALALPVARLTEQSGRSRSIGAVSVTGVDGAERGSVALAGGTVTFTPDRDFNGTAKFAYGIADAVGQTARGSVTVQVRPVNDAPVAADDDVETRGGDPVELDPAKLLANDGDLDGDALSVTEASAGVRGRVAMANGRPVFTPDKGYTGIASFRYVASDGKGGTAAATVRILIGEVSASQQVLGCADRPVVLEDVVAVGGRVKLLGITSPKRAGSEVLLRERPSNRIVARPKVGPDGVFSATVPMPKTGRMDRIHYAAVLGADTSPTLKLLRRMQLTSVRTTADRVTLSGRVAGPFATKAKDRVIEVREQSVCGVGKVVATGRPKADGSFSIAVPRQPGKRGAVYRLFTKVRVVKGNRTKIAPTFTLPRAVDF